ncbi:hypothetical protein AWM70_03270 [Paenibacillus yonginensis]|uniref:Uncharacterized protein n=1 Tax=Paenibacillus yonginensis TaxID=1462996 RepID=A0A1B1MX09_9BACL|nr:hypothetical protein [Paenibacillus yonginensis]ANS73714.1 hypothetical protein AWM70_03270 [Paenibacillus yonginensis]
MFSYKDMMNRFADVFNKDPHSKLGRLISILYGSLQDAHTALETVREWRAISQAQGTTLDMIGQNIAQPRGAATDEVYRVLIQSKIARNLSKTDVNTIIQVLALALNCDYSEIHIQEKYDDPQQSEPAAVSLARLPVKRLNEVGMSPVQFGQIVQKTVAAGVRVALIELSGTFRLSSQYAVLERSSLGLADPDMTTGGALGEVYVPGNDYVLPI